MAEIHMGQLLEKAIEKTGLDITKIAVALRVNPRTIHYWFTLKVIDKAVMDRISDVIKYDSSSGKQAVTIINLQANESPLIKDDAYWKNRYISFLDRYSKLTQDKNRK